MLGKGRKIKQLKAENASLHRTVERYKASSDEGVVKVEDLEARIDFLKDRHTAMNHLVQEYRDELERWRNLGTSFIDMVKFQLDEGEEVNDDDAF